MNKFLLAISAVILLTNCDSPKENASKKTDRMELIPEPDKALREEYEKQQKPKQALPKKKQHGNVQY